MLAFVARRVLQSAIVIGVVLLLAFALFFHVGDPVTALLPLDTPLSDRAEIRQHLGLDRPVLVQFADFVRGVAEGNLGLSYQQRRPVADMLADSLPATIELAVLSTVLATVIGIALGIFVALARESVLSHLLMLLSLVVVSLPTFLTGMLLIQVFASDLGWLPAGGRGELGKALVDIGGWTTGLLTAEGWSRLLLPALTLALFQTTLIMRLLRVEMLQVLNSDFIRMARARGLPRRLIYFRHALRHTLIPVVTVIGLQLGIVIAFGIVTETVFNWPGIGRMFVQAVQAVDIPVMTSYLLLVSISFVAINLIVDCLYQLLDPRLRHGLTDRDSVP